MPHDVLNQPCGQATSSQASEPPRCDVISAVVGCSSHSNRTAARSEDVLPLPVDAVRTSGVSSVLMVVDAALIEPMSVRPLVVFSEASLSWIVRASSAR